MRFLTRFVISVCMVSAALSGQWGGAQDVNAQDRQKNSDKAETTQKEAELDRSNRFKPCEYTTCVTKALYFSNLSQPSELQDAVNTMRTIAEISRVQQIPSVRMVIVKGTPEQIAAAEQLAEQIDKAKGRFGAAGYRIELKVTESEGGNTIHSNVYALLTEDRETARLSVGRPAVAAESKTEGSSENRQATDAAPWGSMECTIISENERTIDLKVDVDLGFAWSDQAKRESGGIRSAGPVQFRMKDRVTPELGKPIVIGVGHDPNSERAFQVELTATRIKGGAGA